MSQDSDQISDRELNNSINALWKCTEKYVQIKSVTEDDEMLNNLQHLMASYCVLDLRCKASSESLAKALNADVSDKTFQETYEKIMAESEEGLSNHEDHPKFKAYLKKVKTLLAAGSESAQTTGEEDEIVITQAEVNTIDPITKQVMVSPMKNKICGHSYDKQSLKIMFRKNSRQRCPYVGCPSKGPFTMDDLEEDYELKEIIRQQQMK